MSGRATEYLTIGVVAVVITLGVAAPVVRAPSDRVFGTEIVGRHHDPFTMMQQFARGVGPAMSLQPVTDVAGAALARVAGPVAAYNWLVVATFPLAAVAAYALARHLVLLPAAAAVAALLFAFSPFHFAHAAYHPHVAQTHWLALYFLALWRCLDHARVATVGWLALSIACVSLSNVYGGLAAAVTTPIAIGAYWWFRSRSQADGLRRLAITVTTVVLVAGAGVAYAWYAALAFFVNRDVYAAERGDLFLHSARWWSYAVPPVNHPLVGASVERFWHAAGVQVGLLEQQVTVGWGVIGLAAVAMIAWCRGGAPQRALTAVPILASVAAVALICSLSPERLIGPFTFVRPSAVLYEIVPMFRAYARFGVVVQLMVAVLAAIGAERLWRSGATRARYLCVTLLLLTAAEYAVWPPALSRDVLPTPAHRWVAELPGHVRALDCAPLTRVAAATEWLTHGRITVQQPPFDDCREPNLLSRLAAAGYTHVLAAPGAAPGSIASEHADDGVELVAQFGRSKVYAITAAAAVVYTEAMTSFYPRESNAQATWRWMARDAAWTIANDSNRTMMANVEIEMSAFQGSRALRVNLDGELVHTLQVAPGAHWYRIGPLALGRGRHELTFRALDPLGVPDAANGDTRPLSIRFGDWRWAVEGERP